MFHKILIANRGDSRSAAEAAAKGHVDAGDVGRSQNRVAREARGD